MDSTLIIDYFETLSAPTAKLLPQRPQARGEALRTVGLGLAACEKAVQVVYEHNLRPSQKLHQPWLDRITRQLLGAIAFTLGDAVFLLQHLRIQREEILENRDLGVGRKATPVET
jgi:hypothetical protein